MVLKVGYPLGAGAIALDFARTSSGVVVVALVLGVVACGLAIWSIRVAHKG